MPHKYEISTTTVAGGAASTPFWLPSVEEAIGMLGHPIWAELLPFLGVLWLVIQAGFFLKEKLWPKEREVENDDS